MSEWINVCKEDEVVAGTGVCALVEGEQVAIFKTRKDQSIYAIANYDPIGKANVLSRGIVGSIGDAVVIASPLYKQHYNLVSGQCLEDREVSVKTYPARVEAGVIELKSG
jgi:nitrite reductase (NADH) small subunit